MVLLGSITLVAALVTVTSSRMESAAQVSLSGAGWTVDVSKEWDVLGPFPIHAREQHFLSPSFPLNLSQPIDYSQTWPSSLADGGEVGWTKTYPDANGHLSVSFPNIRWSALRATEGWAALQHHAVLRTSLTIYPPQIDGPLSSSEPPRLLVNLLQASFFSILPSSPQQGPSLIPEWRSGNIYAMGRSPLQAVHFPVPPSTSSPTSYDIFISGDYEIRLFGDPRSSTDSDVPVLSIDFAVKLEMPSRTVARQPSQDIVCDFLNGYAFGDAIGVALRSLSGWWTVEDAKLLEGSSQAIQISLLHEVTIAPTQTRVVPLKLRQSEAFTGTEIHIVLSLVSEDLAFSLPVTLAVIQQALWQTPEFFTIKASYLYMGSMPTSFLAVPPKESNVGEPRPPILALHGAGVDILDQPFWAQSLPRQKHSWIIMPTGRTPWGMDWHGPSAQDAWQCLSALIAIVGNQSSWYQWKLREDTPVVVVGHSNGGQGAWYLASRYPDRVVAAIPASGYIKSQAYVPLTQSRSAHFMDPALRSILETALTPDDNDLFLTNLVDTPILAVHGGDDDNVPVWHSRAYISVLKTLKANVNASLKEDAGKLHWYPSIFTSERVQEFLDTVLERDFVEQSETFTLTVSLPSESQSLHGWRVESLHIPGRLARLMVTKHNGLTSVKTTNVRSFSLDDCSAAVDELAIDGSLIPVVRDGCGVARYRMGSSRKWLADTSSGESIYIQPSGRMSTVFTSRGTILLVIPDTTQKRAFSIALRIAHDLNLYHKLDAKIITDSEVMQRVRNDDFDEGNIVVIGNTGSLFMQWCLAQRRTAFTMEGATLRLRDRCLNEASMGVLFMHPHPKYAESSVVFLVAEDDSGLERAARAFPMRTGVMVPDWLVIGGRSGYIGAEGAHGAGLWNSGWAWSETMSWLD